MQLQVYVTVAAAEAAGITRSARWSAGGWLDLWDAVRLPLGGDVNEATTFMAYGMLINALAGMGFPPGHRIWDGLHLSAQVRRNEAGA